MLPQSPQEKEDVRLCGCAPTPQARVPTYQEALDAALACTFPASDPPATGVATQVHAPVATVRDEHDWTLAPGAAPPALP